MKTTIIVILALSLSSSKTLQDSVNVTELINGQWTLIKHIELNGGIKKKVSKRNFNQLFNIYNDGTFSLLVWRKIDHESKSSLVLGKWKLNTRNNKVLLYDVHSLPPSPYNNSEPVDRTMDIIGISKSELILRDSVDEWQSHFKRGRQK